MVIHTFGSDLEVNPPIHMLLTQGGLSVNQETWIRNDFIPYDALKDRWKALVSKRLKTAMEHMILAGTVGVEYASLGTGTAFYSFLEFMSMWVKGLRTPDSPLPTSDDTQNDRYLPNRESKRMTGTR